MDERVRERQHYAHTPLQAPQHQCVSCSLAAPHASGASDGAPVGPDIAAARPSWSFRAMACLAEALTASICRSS
eukprot:scaffold33662_cov49-Phaeocystis_antarctica.AAC.4